MEMKLPFCVYVLISLKDHKFYIVSLKESILGSNKSEFSSFKIYNFQILLSTIANLLMVLRVPEDRIRIFHQNEAHGCHY